MDNYKQINSELIAQVQEMRVDIGLYRKELVNLRGELADEHKKRVEEQRRFISILSRHFRESLIEIDPEIDIYQFLGGDEGGGERYSYKNNTVNSREGSKERRSAGIVQELRRSIAIEQRRSDVTMSPTHSRSSGRKSSGGRSSNDMFSRGSLAEEVEMEESDVENEMDQNENNSDETRANKTLIFATTDMDIIAEDDEEETEIMANCEPQIPKQLQTKRLHKDLVLISPLANLTNLSPSTEPESPNIPHIVMRRGNRRHKCDEIEAARCIGLSGFYQKDESVSLPIPNANASKKENSTCGSTSFLIGELSMRHLEDAPSSTPLNLKSQHAENDTRRRSLRSVVLRNSENSPTMPSSTTLSNESNSSRPGRKCKPINLAEPNLNSKMRSEEVKKRSQKKSAAKR